MHKFLGYIIEMGSFLFGNKFAVQATKTTE